MFRKLFGFKRIIIYVLIILVSYFGTLAYLRSDSKSIKKASFEYGSRGQIVSKIQNKLKSYGHYKGNVDGIFGYDTSLAVRDFQDKNGLRIDGIVGVKTLDAMGIDAEEIVDEDLTSTSIIEKPILEFNK